MDWVITIQSASYTSFTAIYKSPKPHHDTIKYRRFKNFDKESFIYDLDTTPWSVIDIFQDVNDKLDTWELIFNSVINQYAPIVEKRVKRKKLPPWMNSSIIDCIRIRDKFKKCAKTNILVNTMYKKLRNQVVKMIANAKSAHMRNEIIENKGNPKKL